MWLALRSRNLGGHKFVRQFPIGPYTADFLCRDRKLVVEIDGSQHVESENDRRRDAYLAAHGYSTLRFWSGDVLANQAQVCDTILAVLNGVIQVSIEAPDLKYVPSSGPAGHLLP